MNTLNVQAITFQSSDSGQLSLRLEDGSVISPAVCVRLFPLSDPDRYISILDGSDKDKPEIGILQDLDALPGDQLELVQADLKQRRFLPEITNVLDIKMSNGMDEWHVETDRGHKVFFVTARKDNIVVTDHNMLIITDIEKCRYRIPDYTQMSPRVLHLVGRALP